MKLECNPRTVIKVLIPLITWQQHRSSYRWMPCSWHCPVCKTSSLLRVRIVIPFLVGTGNPIPVRLSAAKLK
jgi:hypothetical protein